MEASDGDDEGEMGRGPLDHLLDVGEVVPGASASSPVLLGRGGEADPGAAIACSGAETDTPEARALGKRAVSPVGSATAVEQVAAEAMQLPPQRIEGAPGSVEDQPTPMDTEAMPLPPPPPLRTRVAVAKRLPPRSSRKRPAEVPTLAPLKALKVTPGSTTHWVAEAQAALHRGVALARADPKELATQGGVAEAALTEEGEAAPPPRDGEARGSDVAEVPLAVETTGTEVLGVSQARVTEATAPRAIEAAAAGARALATAEAMMAEAGAPQTTEATMAEAGAPGSTEATMAEAGAAGATDADVIVAGLPAREVEMKAAEALATPLVEGPPPLRESAREVEVLPISSDDTSRAQEMASAEVAGVVDQPAPTPSEGSSALARVRPEPYGWNHPHVRWQSRDDPEAEPLFALEDTAEGGRWDTFE
ncbi:uncharacterized protein [Miscanthus floridulus]|uniref:uncharacterized protein n=1 Tax=Miscanthus floridulus TaxID=154761 RepID=UPI00345986DB